MEMNKYKDWEVLEVLPIGWKVDNSCGSPLSGYDFCTDGKSVLNGGKRALVKTIRKGTPRIEFIEPIKSTKIVEKKEIQEDYVYPANTVNTLARKKFQAYLLKEIMFDLMVCEIEEWDKKEYINEINKKMRKFELQLIDVLRIQSYSGDFKHMSRFICKKITKMGLSYTKDKLGNIYVVKGESDVYPTMVCHIDTVHMFDKNYQVHQAGRNIFAVNKVTCDKMGVGGDDKVGVFMTLKMLEERDVFKAAFFVDEEIGCVGSRACDFDFFSNSSLVLECDRKGAYDFVNSISGTKLYSREFSEAIKPILFDYGRTEVSGGMTDVLEIAYKTKICVANMSCGYYHPHSDDEFVNIDDVFMTYNMCNDIYDKLGFDLWRVSEDRNEYDYYGGYGYSSYGTSGYAQSCGKSSQSYLPVKEDDFDFEDWNNSFGVESERSVKDNIGMHKGMECLYCGGVNAELDEYNRDVYCHDCGSFITEDEYLDFIDELN